MLFAVPKTELFTAVILNGGSFVNSRKLRYNSNFVAYFDFCDVDKVSIIELPRNHHVHIYLVEIDESVGPQAEPFAETEYEFEEPNSYSETGPEFKFQAEPFEPQDEPPFAPQTEPVAAQDKPPFVPQYEPIITAQTKPFETQYGPPFAPQTEPIVAAQTDSSDTEYLDSTTESESSFEDSDYSVEDVEEVVQPLFTDTSCRNQFRTHFEEERDASEIRVESDNETEYGDSLHRVDDSDSNLDGSVRKKRFSEFNAETDIENHELKVGMIFVNREVLKEAVMNYIKNEYCCNKEFKNVKLTNPGTTSICKLDDRVFEMVYICMQACKDGLKAGCRPIICLDGCHLKRYYKGHLLAAIGIDANDWLYPIAFAAVESECHESWYWFLELLATDLELNNSHNISLISNRQNGLIDALGELFPHSNHRTCVRHLYTNFKKQHTGKAFKDGLWKAARATYDRAYEDAMLEVKSLSSEAYDWLIGMDPKNWSKHFFHQKPNVTCC
ncbi:hypothetical protein GQ457_06G007570 [Hibiscus cannabinus]